MPSIPESIPINLQTITATVLSFVIVIGSSAFIGARVQKNKGTQITIDANGRPVEVNIKKIDTNGYIYELALTPDERNTLCEKCRRAIAADNLGSNETISARGNEQARVRGDMQVLFGSSQYVRIYDRNFGGRELNESDILQRDTTQNLDSLDFRINNITIRNVTNEIKASAIQDAQARFLLRRGVLRRTQPQQPQNPNA